MYEYHYLELPMLDQAITDRTKLEILINDIQNPLSLKAEEKICWIIIRY